MIEFYGAIDGRIRRSIDSGKYRFAICSMDINGIVTKQILNYRYGIDEEYIIDNGLASINSRIIRSCELGEYDCYDLTVILNSTNESINTLLFNDLIKTVSKEQIINILDAEIIQAPEKSAYFADIRKLIKIRDVSGTGKYLRVGSTNDGGYVMLDTFARGQWLAYSFGIGNDISWDLDIANYGIDVFMYDHTVRQSPKNNDLFHFHRIGIAGDDQPDRGLLSMETIMKQNGHEACDNILLKMDVEGAEWDFINSVSPHTLSHFSQITIEFHSVTDKDKGDVILQAFEKLNKTHQVVWVHGNNYAYAQVANDILIPAFLEATYVRRADFDFCESSRCFPTELDMTNYNGREDFMLGNWG